MILTFSLSSYINLSPFCSTLRASSRVCERLLAEGQLQFPHEKYYSVTCCSFVPMTLKVRGILSTSVILRGATYKVKNIAIRTGNVKWIAWQDLASYGGIFDPLMILVVDLHSVLTLVLCERKSVL